VGVGFQPALAALLVLAQLPLPVLGPVGLLAGHRQPTQHPGWLVAAAAEPAKHAGRLAAGGLLEVGQGGLGLLAVGGGPGQFPAAIAGGLVELAAKPVPLGPQLRRGQPLEIRAAQGVDGQGLAARPRQGLGQLQVPIGPLPVGQIQLPSPLGFGPDHRVQASVLAGPRQLHIQPVHVFGAGEPDQGPPPGQPLGAVAGGGIGQVDPPVALPGAAAVQIGPGRRTSRPSVPSRRTVNARASGSRAVTTPRLPLATPSSPMALWPHTTRSPTASFRSSTRSRSPPRRPRVASSSWQALLSRSTSARRAANPTTSWAESPSACW
jgi:hypothetical protein